MRGHWLLLLPRRNVPCLSSLPSSAVRGLLKKGLPVDTCLVAVKRLSGGLAPPKALFLGPDRDYFHFL